MHSHAEAGLAPERPRSPVARLSAGDETDGLGGAPPASSFGDASLAKVLSAVGAPWASSSPELRDRSAAAPGAQRDVERAKALYGSVTVGVIAEALAIAVLIAVLPGPARGTAFVAWLGFMAASVFSCARIGTSANTVLPWV